MQLGADRAGAAGADPAGCLAFGVLFLAACLGGLSMGLFWLGVPMGPWHLPLALALTLAALGWWVRAVDEPRPLAAWARASATLLALLAGFLWLANQGLDFSYDGQHYHLMGILSLVDGWNPIREPFLDWHIYPVRNYPKFSWLWEAATAALLGPVEAGKAFNFLFAAAAGAVVWRFLGRAGLAGPWLRLWLAALAALGPITLPQLYTHRVDGMLAGCFAMALCLSVDWWRWGRRRDLALLCLCGLVMTNIKYTGLVYFGIMTGLFWLAMLWRRRERQWSYLTAAATAMLLGALVLGYNPYVLNTLHYKSPFYPMPYENVARFQAPPQVIEKDRFSKLAWSLLAETEVNMKKLPTLKPPFVVHGREITKMHTSSLRYGGLGPWFSGALLLSVLAAAAAWRRRPRAALAALALSAVVMATVLTVSETWYFRFIPQLWFLPLIWAAALLLPPPGGRLERVLAWALLAVLTGNQLMVLAGNAPAWLENNRGFRTQAAELAASPEPILARVEWLGVRRRLADYGVRAVWVDQLPCAEPLRVVGTHATAFFCPPAPAR